MILITLAATAAVALIQAPEPVVCPTSYEALAKGAPVNDYNGVRFTYCCADCPKAFLKDPQAALDKAAKAGKTIGVFMFDAVTKMPIDSAKAKGGSSDYKGVRFFFNDKAEKATFDKAPKEYGTLPKKEALYCPINKAAVSSYAKASGYGDFEGTRYYFCCGGCETPFAKDPAKYAPFAKDAVSDPKAQTPPAKTDGQD